MTRTLNSWLGNRRAVRARVLAMLACALAGAAPPKVALEFPGTRIPSNRHIRPPSDPAVSFRHLPASLEIRSEAQLNRFRALTAGMRMDSTRHWESEGGRLSVSHDLLQDLAGGNLPITGATHGERFAAFLSRSQGMDFQASGSAYATYLPDDPFLLGFPQWSLHNDGHTFLEGPGTAGVDIDIERVWDKFSGSDSLVVAVVDAGFDFNHPDLKGKNWINQAEAKGLPGIDDDNNGYVDDSLGWDFVDNDNLPQDYHGHGTYISSVIAGGFDNHEGIAGILSQGKIMPVRVLDASGHGDQAAIAKGITYAVRNGAKVINFSIGGAGDDKAMRTAFQAAFAAGVPIIVAAGNDGQDLNAKPAYPGAYNLDNMLVVAAHDHNGLLCGFSNFGKTAVNLAAPGYIILVAGTAAPKEIWREDFEEADSSWSTGGNFALSTDSPVAGKQSLAWAAGNASYAMAPDTFDLTGIKGATLGFHLEYKPVNAFDALIVEGNKIGSAIWTEIAVFGYAIAPTQALGFGLQSLDGSKFRLRFRASLSTRYSSSARVLKIDDVTIAVPDPNPPKEPAYPVVAGTSVAAPMVAAYVGLQRLACDRMGIPWTKALALTGVTPESSLVGKVSTGGRLDVYNGLEFYLKTLPDLRIEDSTVRTWKSGQKVAYSLSMSPAPAETYVLSGTGLPEGAVIDGAGMMIWSPQPQQTGEFSLRLKAEGPTVLRKLFTFAVEGGETVALRPPLNGQAAGKWSWGGQTFRLRPGLDEGRHWVEVFGTNAAGKVQLLKREWMDADAFSRPQEVPKGVSAAHTVVFARLQIRVDGIYLASGG
ncbi:MAG: S8 family peptidase [Fibrobacteria bacterium]